MKSANYKAEEIMNVWETAERGVRKSKKVYKKDIRRQRRVLEKRMLREEIDRWSSDG